MADIFPIDKILNKLKTAPLQPAYFQVTIDNKNLVGLVPYDTVPLLCQNATLPGVSISATDNRRSGVGNIEKRPNDISFQDLSLSFMVDGKGDVVKLFQRWIQSIYKFDAGNGLNNVSRAGLKTYTFEYPDTYESTITITQYQIGDESNPPQGPNFGSNKRTANENSVIQYKLYNAYPHTIGSMETGWSTVNQYHVLPVQFYYQSWSSNLLEVGSTYQPTDSYKPGRLDIPDKLTPLVEATQQLLDQGADLAAGGIRAGAGAFGIQIP